MARDKTLPELLEELRVPIAKAMQDSYADTGKRPEGSAIFRQLLKTASETERRLPDAERAFVYSMRSVWPSSMVDREGETAAFEETLKAIKEGSLPPDFLAPRVRVTAAEVSAYELVTLAIPQLLVGYSRRDDWTALWLRARGMDLKPVAKRIGVSWQTIANRLSRQHTAVSSKLQPYMPSKVQWDQAESRARGRIVLSETSPSSSR